MNQTEVNAEIDQYLQLVRKKLSMLPDAEAIVQELHTHIWESANKYATKDGLSIETAFRKALDQMEDPEILANRFYEESGYEYSASEPSVAYQNVKTNVFTQNFHNKSVVPEKKLSQDKFFLIALIGFISVMIIGSTLISTIKDPFISLLGTSIQIVAFGCFIAYLYYRDDVTFKEQIAILREKFEKAHTRHLDEKRSKLKRKNKDFLSPQFQALIEHLSGALGAIVMFILMLFVFYVSYINVQPFFNDYWYSIGIIIIFILLGCDMIYFSISAFTGKVRGLRMVDSLNDIISAIGIFILIFYYPFTIGSGVLQLAGNKITDPNVITFLSTKIDYYIRIIMGIVVVVNIMQAIYSIFKFETWKPKDTRSLLSL